MNKLQCDQCFESWNSGENRYILSGVFSRNVCVFFVSYIKTVVIELIIVGLFLQSHTMDKCSQPISVALTPIFRDDEVHDTRHEAVIGMESQFMENHQIQLNYWPDSQTIALSRPKCWYDIFSVGWHFLIMSHAPLWCKHTATTCSDHCLAYILLQNLLD